MKTFGTDVTGQPTSCERIKVSVGNTNKFSSKKIECIVVPTICAPIGNQEIDTAIKRLAYLRDIELADGVHGNEELEIDLLIRAVFMWLFFTGATKRGKAAKALWQVVRF